MKLSPTIVFFFLVGMAVLGFADFTIKQTAGKVSPALGTLVYAVVAILPPLLWTLWTVRQEPLLVTRDGVFWAGMTGLAFGIFTGILFLLFSLGVNLSLGTPIVRMGGILFAAVLGLVVFREAWNWQYVIGFVLAVVGILLIATR